MDLKRLKHASDGTCKQPPALQCSAPERQAARPNVFDDGNDSWKGAQGERRGRGQAESLGPESPQARACAPDALSAFSTALAGRRTVTRERNILHLFIHVYIHTYVHIYIHTYTHIHKCIYVYACVLDYTQSMYICTRINSNQ